MTPGAIPIGERAAALEAQMKDVRADIVEIKKTVETTKGRVTALLGVVSLVAVGLAANAVLMILNLAHHP